MSNVSNLAGILDHYGQLVSIVTEKDLLNFIMHCPFPQTKDSGSALNVPRVCGHFPIYRFSFSISIITALCFRSLQYFLT